MVRVDPGVQDELAAENLALEVRAAEAIDAQVLLEPISGAKDYPLRTAADAIAVADRVCDRFGPINIGLLADLYHLSVKGDDVDRVIADFGHRVDHVQIADNPGGTSPARAAYP